MKKINKLRQYLFQEGISIMEFARRMDYSWTIVGEYVRGKVRFGKKAAKIVEKLTEGKVTAQDILNENPPKKPKKV